MQMARLWHARARNALPDIHTTRLRSLFAAVGGLLLGRQLWLTGVGRHLATNVSEKHQIKRVDRLLRNAGSLSELVLCLCVAKHFDQLINAQGTSSERSATVRSRRKVQIPD